MARIENAMSEHYRVLGAVLSLKEFTVADLARFSGVKPTTIRTVLSREPELLEDIGKEETGSRGGRFTRYRLRHEKADGLRSEIQQLYRQMGSYVGQEGAAEESSAYKTSLPVLAAQDALIRRFPETTDLPGKLALIEFARTVAAQEISHISEGTNKPGVPAQQEFDWLCLRALSDLCSVELVISEKRHLLPHATSILRDLFLSLVERGSRLGESDRSNALLRRLLLSPILDLGEQPQFALDRKTSLASILQSRDDPEAHELVEDVLDLPRFVQEQEQSRAIMESEYLVNAKQGELALEPREQVAFYQQRTSRSGS